MLASNLDRLFLHMKQYHFQFPIRFFLSYLANIRSNYCNPQIIYVANSFFFFFSVASPPHVFHWWFLHMSCKFSLFLPFSSVLALLSLWGSVVFVIWLRRYFNPPISPEHLKPSQKILLIASYLFLSKNGSGSNWYSLLVIRFYANGDPPLEIMQTANLASSDSHLLICFSFFKRQRSEFHLRFTRFYSRGPIIWSLWNKTVLDYSFLGSTALYCLLWALILTMHSSLICISSKNIYSKCTLLFTMLDIS